MNKYTFHCKKCEYSTPNKQSHDRHLIAGKHDCKELQKYICECGKKYKHRQSLYNHKRKCNFNECENENENENIKITPQMFYNLIEQNNELHKKIMEIVSTNGGDNNTIIINNAGNNTTFNLNFFLNERCKDAINMSDFVNSCKIEISDLEETGELGYVEGISRILIKNLEELGLDLRPMHCSDMKREVLYIKDNNVWVKEAENQEKIKNVIREISNKNFKQIYEWQKINPDFSNPQSRVSDRYQKLLFNILPGITQEEQSENINKIFKNIIKQITIDK
jgi:Txe/YoeB family toxin of Txe-Axe toxin-antitoxin module